MLEFPYVSLPGGITRPLIAVLVEGPSNRRLLDGLLDTGSDRTVFPAREAKAIGVILPTAPDGSFKTAGGISIGYRLAEVILELRDARMSARWNAEVAFADEPLMIVHLGHRGFLEHFHVQFQGPERRVLLDPRPGLPSR